MGSGEQDYLTQLYGAPAPLNLTYSSNYYGSVVDIGQYRWLYARPPSSYDFFNTQIMHYLAK
jgi:hypothetical protein